MTKIRIAKGDHVVGILRERTNIKRIEINLAEVY